MGVNSSSSLVRSGAVGTVSYSINVGRPKAVMRADETEGELYSRGGGRGGGLQVVKAVLSSSFCLGKV